jgi:hypothetical protein
MVQQAVVAVVTVVLVVVVVVTQLDRWMDRRRRR